MLSALTAVLLLAGCNPTPPTNPNARNAGRLKVVSLAPNMTEIVCALGASDMLAGRTSVCNYPEEELRVVPVIGGFGKPSIEKILAIQPDIVLEVDLEDESAGRMLDRFGLRRERIPCGTLDEIPSAIETVGRLLGREKEAAALAGQIRAETTRRRAAAAASAARPRVFVELWDAPPMTVGARSFISELVKLAGGENIGDYADKDYFNVSAEWVIKQNPDVILCLHAMPDNDAARVVAGRPGWDNINAIKNNMVFGNLDADPVMRPGPRVILGADLLERHIRRREDQ